MRVERRSKILHSLALIQLLALHGSHISPFPRDSPSSFSSETRWASEGLCVRVEEAPSLILAGRYVRWRTCMPAHIVPPSTHAIPIKIGCGGTSSDHCERGRISLLRDNRVSSRIQERPGSVFKYVYIHCSQEGGFAPSVHESETLQSLCAVPPHQNERNTYSEGSNSEGDWISVVDITKATLVSLCLHA